MRQLEKNDIEGNAVLEMNKQHDQLISTELEKLLIWYYIKKRDGKQKGKAK